MALDDFKVIASASGMVPISGMAVPPASGIVSQVFQEQIPLLQFQANKQEGSPSTTSFTTVKAYPQKQSSSTMKQDLF